MLYDYLVDNNKAAFLQRVSEISAALGINPDWLMFVMKTESGITSTAVNPHTGATGLIQFMPATAAGLGTSLAEIARMNNVQQLEYVYKYFKPYAGKLHSAADLYAVTFFPKVLGQPDEYVLQTDTISAAKIAGQNPIFDLNKNGEITAGEFRKAVFSRYPSGFMATAEQAADYLKKK